LRHLLLIPAVGFTLAGLAAQQPPPTFKSGVEVVRIDVSVVDKTGKPLSDLTPADFTVTVDRKPRAIVSAQFLKYEIGTKTTKERGEADVVAEMIRRNCGNGGVPDCKGRVLMVAHQVAIQAHLRGQRSLDALAGIAEGLAGVEGPKTVFFVSGGLPMPDEHSLAAFDKLESTFAAAQISLYTLYLEWSPFGRPRYKPSPTAVQDIREESWGLENATSVVGGTLMDAIGTYEQ
jgi:hypothetical protein